MIIRAIMPFEDWGAIYLAVGLLTWYRLFRTKVGAYRLFLSVAVFLTTAWELGFIVAGILGHLRGATAVITWAFISLFMFHTTVDQANPRITDRQRKDVG